MDRITRLPSVIRDPETYALIGAAMEVHRFLGPGFLESVYREAFRIELSFREVTFSCEVELPVCYKDRRLEAKFRADFLCSGVIVELKAVPALSGPEERQLINYLKAGQIGRGLLINFGGPSLQFKRYVLSESPGP